MNFGKTFVMMILLVLALAIVPFGHSSPCGDENPCRRPRTLCNCPQECCSRSCTEETATYLESCDYPYY
ncbi:unnamed protein product [Allacma fusca]|uniref:Uncharacterized protein n=1 Tax=Allacma fusca TaxID=39272 RepID=A0A8J2P8J8_9HEXA|nr:unnamed protein product [Allacma fusca]